MASSSFHQTTQSEGKVPQGLGTKIESCKLNCRFIRPHSCNFSAFLDGQTDGYVADRIFVHADAESGVVRDELNDHPFGFGGNGRRAAALPRY